MDKNERGQEQPRHETEPESGEARPPAPDGPGLPFAPTNDAFFKRLFERRQKDLLPSLAAGILDVNPTDIKDLSMETGPEIAPEGKDSKFCRLDIRIITKGQIIDLEVQVHHHRNYIDRTLFYWASQFASATRKGASYKDLPRTIVASILGFDMFPDWAGHRSKFMLLETSRHRLLSDKLEMQYYELPKCPEFREGEAPMDQWLHFFRAKTKEDLAILESKGDKFMKQAVMEYNTLAKDEAFIREAEFWEDRRRREESALAAEREYGIEVGREEGIEIGMEKGREEMRRMMQAENQRMLAELESLRAELARRNI